jgi:LysR family glycine cleavage system transcriptional activator
MARREIRSGALAAPFPVVLSIPAHFRFVCPLGDEDRPPVRRFMDFVRAEAASDADLMRGRTVVPVG